MKQGRIFLICLFLVNAVVLEKVSADEDYFALFMGGKKVGHTIQQRNVSEQKVTTSEKVVMTISRGNIPITIKVTETCVETLDGKPLSFEAIQDMSLMTMTIKGTVSKDGTVSLTTISTAGQAVTTFPWPDGAVMAEGLRLIQQKKGLKEGTSYSAKLFSPANMLALETKVKIGVRENVDLLGRVVPLTKVLTSMTMPGAGEIAVVQYVDDELKVQKTVMPVMGMNIEMIACAKEFAFSDNDVFEMIDKMFVASPEPLENIESAEAISYLLRPTDPSENLVIPTSDNQKVRQKDNSVIVLVRPVKAAQGTKFPYRGSDANIREALEPTQYIQSNDQKIIKLARQAIGNTKDAAEAVKKIESFVAEYMENKGLSVGYASAVEVADSKQGDCSEFAVLTAALCRAVGIPARVATGIAYIDEFAGIENSFGGHAWTEAYVGGKWVGLDSAFKSAGLAGFDAGHITLAIGNGEPAGFFNLAATMGKFKIEKVMVK